MDFCTIRMVFCGPLKGVFESPEAEGRLFFHVFDYRWHPLNALFLIGTIEAPGKIMIKKINLKSNFLAVIIMYLYTFSTDKLWVLTTPDVVQHISGNLKSIILHNSKYSQSTS